MVIEITDGCYMKIINFKGKAQPDPYIIKDEGFFYIYCTGTDGIYCYKSERLSSDWQYVGMVLSVEGQTAYWAPSVIKVDGKFYMYYSSVSIAETKPHMQRIKVAVSDTPCGKFDFVKDLLPPFSIDAHVVENETGMYIFYSVNDYEAVKAGTYIVVDKMIDPFTVKGEPKAVVKPTIEEEIFAKDRFKKGQDWFTIEGAFYFKKDGVHYCIYSANSYLKPTYHLGYAYSEEQSDELNKITFVKNSPDKYSPLLCSNDKEISTGHCSMIEDNGEMYLVYHGRDVNSDLSADDRTARICKLIVKNKKLFVAER